MVIKTATSINGDNQTRGMFFRFDNEIKVKLHTSNLEFLTSNPDRRSVHRDSEVTMN